MQFSRVARQGSTEREPNQRFRNGLELIASFKEQFEALSDADNIRMLGSLGSGWFTNSDVRSLLGSHRQTSWVKLSRLARTGLVEKRGHSYRIPPYARDLVVSLSAALANLVALKELSGDSELSRLFLVASEGIDLLYSKGRLDQGEYERAKEVLGRMT